MRAAAAGRLPGCAAAAPNSILPCRAIRAPPLLGARIQPERPSPNTHKNLPACSGADVAREYASLLSWYEDFWQRRALGRLRSLLAERAALPIAPYERAIVEAVRANPCVVIAGDTGAARGAPPPPPPHLRSLSGARRSAAGTALALD